MTELEKFLAGERYEIDNGPQNRDRRLTQIRGMETTDTIRHIVGEMTAKARSVEARGVDQDTDQDQAEIEAALVEQELANPWKGYNARRYEALMSAREKRLGVVWMDWDPECGPYGEILYSFQDPRRIMWDPAFDPHHPLCPLLFRSRRIDVELARKTYKAPWLQPDRESFDKNGKVRPGVPLLRGMNGEYTTALDYQDDNNVTLWEFWYKNDKTTYKRDKAGSEVPFDSPDMNYMACTSGCGYRSPNQGEVADMAEAQAPQADPFQEQLVSAYLANDGELPEEMPGCPKCAAEGMDGTLERVEATGQSEEVLAYSRGKRLLIMAPCSPGPDDKPLYDGKWPVPTVRSFPAFFCYAYVKPGEPVGPCDVDLMWDQQIACDNLRTIMLQRVFEHRNYWIMPKNGITDFRGFRFEHREDQYNVMFRDSSLQYDTRVEQIDGTGVDPNAINVFNVMQASLTQYRGVADFGFTPENTKDIAASTVAQLTQQGNIPTADAKRRMNEEESKFYGCVSDYIHATYTPDRIARLNIDGVDIAARMWGQDLYNYDFVVEETPDFTGLEKARSEAWQALMQTYQQAVTLGLDPSMMIEIYAQVNNLPKSIVRKFEKMLQAAKDAAQEAMDAHNAPPTEQGGGAQDILAQLMAEGAGAEPQPNGNGMEPLPAA